MYFIYNKNNYFIVYCSLSKDRARRKLYELINKNIIEVGIYDLDYLELDKFLGVKI